MVPRNDFPCAAFRMKSVTQFLNVPKKDWRRMMRRFIFWFAVLAIAIPALPLLAAHAQSKEAAAAAPAASAAAPANSNEFKVEQQKTNGSVTVEGKVINYDAYAGTLVVHPTGWDDVPQDVPKDDKNPPVEASMFYVAYMKSGADPSSRPVTFIYNGGPGSSTVWLHMGAFGPRRVVTADDTHTPAAPYSLVNNDFSLLDASDLVFVDAPGTGFSRVAGPNKEKAFYGVDQDGHAFAEFITQFLAKYGRWNSPKYLFGESYGTTRSAVLIAMLEGDYDVDFNGVMLLSQILGFDNSVDGPEFNPGIDLPYELGLPTYAATAWYHHKLPNQPSDLESFLKDVEHFSMNEYALALGAGTSLPVDQRQAIAGKLHDYTGLPVEYILKANLRIDGGEFEKNLLDQNGLTTGRLDTRFSGPSMDPLSKEADYDPQSASISSAYVSAFNDYVRKQLKFGEDRTYKPEINTGNWDITHHGNPGTPNVMIDLANAMKYNPNLKVLLNAGYFDLATPFYEGVYEMEHLPIPQNLVKNIEFRFYQSGHMVYAHEPSLKQLHDNAAEFIASTDNVKNR
jgi:carboxypeptidase C (cathepsin A)